MSNENQHYRGKILAYLEGYSQVFISLYQGDKANEAFGDNTINISIIL